MQKIFDAHFHLWDLKQLKLAWLEKFPDLKHNFSLKDLQKAYEDFEFLGGLYVEVDSEDKKAEAQFALGLKQYGIRLCLADLEYHNEQVAFREVLHTSVKGAQRLFDEDFKALLKRLEESHLVFEACMKNEELYFLEDILKQNPNLKIVLNHMGSPKISHLKSYEKSLSLLGQNENLFIKLSAADDFSQETSEDFIFEIFALLQKYFKEERLIFGSNYPVASLSPKEWIALITKSKLFKNLDLIFYQNALQIYKGG